MTEYKKKCLEMRRMRFEHEANGAKRAERMANIIKVAAFVVASIVLTVCAYLIVRDYQARTERIMEANGLKAEAYSLMLDAADAVRRNPDNGLAKFALLAGIALYCADVTDAEG